MDWNAVPEMPTHVLKVSSTGRVGVEMLGGSMTARRN